jgi:hypothetical protein
MAAVPQPPTEPRRPILDYYTPKPSPSGPSAFGRWLGRSMIVVSFLLLPFVLLLHGSPLQSDAIVVASGALIWGLAILWQGRDLLGRRPNPQATPSRFRRGLGWLLIAGGILAIALGVVSFARHPRPDLLFIGCWVILWGWAILWQGQRLS